MSDNRGLQNAPPREQIDENDPNIADYTPDSSSVKTFTTRPRLSSTSERQIKFEKAQRCLENAALVSKRIKEHRKATAELLGRPFEDDDVCDTASEMTSLVSEKTGYSAATDTSTTLSVQEALNIPGISENLANTLKQKELLMERIKQYKEISKRPHVKSPSIKPATEAKFDPKKISQIATSNIDTTQLKNTIKDKENVITSMQVKIKALETTILDYQEKISEKDQIISAKTQASSLLSDNMSKKEKDSMSLLEDTRQQMAKMDENYKAMESEWKEEKQRLLHEISTKNERISSLEEANSILETARFEISVAHSKLLEELDEKNKFIIELESKLEALSESRQVETPIEKHEEEKEEKGSVEIANMEELSKRIEMLEQLNCQMRKTNIDLENKLASLNTSKAVATTSPSKKASPLPTRKGKNTRMKSPWSNLSSEPTSQEPEKAKSETAKADIVQSLNKDIIEKELIISQKDAIIADLEIKLGENEKLITELDQAETKKNTVDIDTNTEIPYEKMPEPEEEKPCDTSEIMSMSIEELQQKLLEAQKQITELHSEIETANKNMLKVKSNHKLKLKQMQKTIDNFSKVSDSNAEITKLNEELHQLTQKVAELEEEKGNLQLHLVDYDSGRLTESDTYKKMMEMEVLAESRLKAITILETQKLDLVQELHILQQKNEEMEDKLSDLTQLQSEQVCNEMRSVQLEEEVDRLTAAKKELELIIDNLNHEKNEMLTLIKQLQNDYKEIMLKLEQYKSENMDLTDKLEKMSAEKVSSAESIEIVESLTTQEKMELEEYNKAMSENKALQSLDAPLTEEYGKSIDQLVLESAELNKKIELFTQERQEVMEKMNKLNLDNEELQQKIFYLTTESNDLHFKIQTTYNDKTELEAVNAELNRQIEDLKRQRLEVMKDVVDISKPAVIVESAESTQESHHDDKATSDKNKGAKTVKQLTKEILKLKNVIKEREAEIADCKMKILSLEEQQQKQSEILESSVNYEMKIKALIEENANMKEELNKLKLDKEKANEMIKHQDQNELLQQELSKIQQDYAANINARDTKIAQLESVLVEYEKQVYNFSTSIQQKDKELTDYVNQIAKLNDVSHKLKSTIEVLEEEKAKDNSSELIKSLNKQIGAYQKKLAEYDERIRMYEEEKTQLLSLRSVLETQNNNLEAEIQKLKETLNENQVVISDLQAHKDKFSAELLELTQQTKERDEEIHEIKLQLRKESIENEKLRDQVCEKDKVIDGYITEIDDLKDKISKSSTQTDEVNTQFANLESKNKEYLEKLKKYAANIKKRTAMYTELENQYHDLQGQLERKNTEVEQLNLQIESLPSIQEKLRYAEDEINRLMSVRVKLEQDKSNDDKAFEGQLKAVVEERDNLLNTLAALRDELSFIKSSNESLISQIEQLNNKLVQMEIEHKNNSNNVTKISSLENELFEKQTRINQLLNSLDMQQEQTNQFISGHDAKLQEKDLYIEGLEMEISKYKSRIGRLEECISTMEERRNSLERKANELDSQLQEKQKAYNEFSNQEDEMVNRLAALMNHDRVLEIRLNEVSIENSHLQSHVNALGEENEKLKKCLADYQSQCFALQDRADKFTTAEAELASCKETIRELDSNLKKLSTEHQHILTKSRHEIEELEAEFNSQIENAIKEKKMLSEKYEKLAEQVTYLEKTVHEYKVNINTLTVSLDEAHREIQRLQQSEGHVKMEQPDYTEQYISEINRLNSIINTRNQDFESLNASTQTLKANFSAEVAEMKNHLNSYTETLEKLNNEILLLKDTNNQLETSLSLKDDHLKQLIDKKRVTFEMNIPKTEGMIISSTIEPLNEITSENIDMATLESQIVDMPFKETETFQTSSQQQGIEEPVAVSKKAYLCYTQGEDTNQEAAVEMDPFNSEEGWGLGEAVTESDVIMPGFTQLNAQLQQLQDENETLKADLAAANSKLLKAMKKLKEFKASNEILKNEVTLSKQLTENSMFESAIEDELKNQIADLEKQILEFNKKLQKEKKEKDSILKQNEVINSANERLMEMKEKQDNEIELWKYKFKEVNDKIDTLQWGNEGASNPVQTIQSKTDSSKETELGKLEKENDELNGIVDQLTKQNHELSAIRSKLEEELCTLKSHQQSLSTDKLGELQVRLDKLQMENIEINNINKSLKEEVESLQSTLQESIDKHNALQAEYKHLDEIRDSDLQKCRDLEEQCSNYSSNLEETNKKMVSLGHELEDARIKINQLQEECQSSNTKDVNDFAATERFNNLLEQFNLVKAEHEKALENVIKIESENAAIIKQLKEEKIKIEKLNLENDQLLSTVTELRSSISSAVDQRGYEIAELWKQHLAQRENDFQKIEHELRSQLGAAEQKYELLFDTVQSSNQEETDKLIMVEQISSLQAKLQDKENHLTDLQNKYASAIEQLDILRSEIDDEKLMLENKLLVQQEEFEKQLKDASVKLQELTDSNKQLKELLQQEQTAITDAKTTIASEQDERAALIVKLEAKVSELSHELHLKDVELSQKSHEFTIAFAQRNEEFEVIRKQLIEYEKKIEDLAFEKESELAVLRLRMHENKEYFDKVQSEIDSDKSQLSEALNAKIIECGALNRQITDLNKSLEDHSTKASEMQTVLENQEMDIVALKDEIEELQNALRVSTSKIEKHVTFASDTKPGAEEEGSNVGVDKQLLDFVPRAELDLALYLLHQRDVRCEELTMELTQLLEERDTLQLRLSDSLRSYEELKNRYLGAEVPSSSEALPPGLPSFSIEKEQFVDTHRAQSSRSSSVSDMDADKPKLQAKLSELRSVKQNRDVLLRHDSEQRQLGIRLMQRDVANLPPEAIEQLQQAQHSLSRDAQSTPTVLLNWLRGKTTPKVVHM